MENDLLLKETIEKIEYTLFKDVLVKTLSPIRVEKPITEQIPTGELDEMGYQKYDTKTEIKEAIENIKTYAKDNDGKFFMLLCNELKYYTVFVKDNGRYEMSNEVIECAAELGKLKSVSIDENGAVELWVQPDGDEPHVMYFFNYDKGVIVCQ